MEQEQKKDSNAILILGGTNFMGKTLLQYIDRTMPNTNVYCINRGVSYWNNQARKNHPKYVHYIGDRDQHKDMTKLIKYINKKLSINQDNKWKAVIDFSGFKWRDVQSVVKAIQNCAQKYIFISTDSIYNISTETLQSPVRQHDFNLNQQYLIQKAATKKKDKYGYNKLKCQIYLRKTNHVRFICLRLPDVIGPYDNTHRMWCYVKLLQNPQIPIYLTDKDQTKKWSFVYSVDVVNLILQLINQTITKSESYNIGCKETLTLKQIISEIANQMKVTPNFVNNNQSFHFLPSVNYGNISSQKAQKELGWSPSPISKAIKQSVEFFLNYADKYENEKKEMQKDFKQKLY